MPIRVLHVIPSLGVGGAERQLVERIANLNRAKYSHVICYLRPPDSLAAGICRAGGTVVGLGLRGKHPLLSAAARLGRIARTHRIDIIHTSMYDANISARLLRLAGHREPIVTSLETTEYEPDVIAASGWSPTKVAALRLLDRLSARWSGASFVAVSRFVEQSAIRWLRVHPAKIRVIPNGVDPEALRFAPGEPQRLRQALAIPADGLVYTTVARLAPGKGHHYLLQAFARLAASHADSYLALVGDGPLAADLRQLAGELGIERRVRMLGSRADVGACLAMADVFVFPTLFEGFGLALAEAMFAGLPCIASRVGPLPEMVEDGITGVLVEPGSVDEFTAAMVDLHRDPTRRRTLGTEAQREANRRFHIRTTISRWEALYCELAASAG